MYASYGLRPPSGMRNSIYGDIIIVIIIVVVVVVVAVAVVGVDLPALASLHP